MATFTATGIRFQKACKTELAQPTAVTQVTAQVMAREMQGSAPWVFVKKNITAILAATRTEAAANPDLFTSYDCYTLCGQHAEAAGTHMMFAGAAIYRITLPDAFSGRELLSLTATVGCDAWAGGAGAGIRVAVLSDADRKGSESGREHLPTMCWTCLREGSTDPARKMFAPSAVTREENSEGKVRANMADVTVQPASGASPKTLGKYLWVCVSMESYTRSTNAWYEGAGMLGPVFTLETDGDVPGFGSGDYIGGGHDTLTASDWAQLGDTVTLSEPGTGHGAAATGAGGARETALADFAFSYIAPLRPSDPLTAWEALRAWLAVNGAAPAPDTFTPQGARQAGIACRVVHCDVSPTAPHTQMLRHIVSAVAAWAAPMAPPPTHVWLGAAEGVRLTGARVRLAAYWIEGRLCGLAEAGMAAGAASAGAGGEDLKTEGLTARFVGAADMPPEIAPGGGLLIPLDGLPGTAGTLVVAPRLTRVSELPAFGSYSGLAVPDGADPMKWCAGWTPEIRLLF